MSISTACISLCIPLVNFLCIFDPVPAVVLAAGAVAVAEAAVADTQIC